MWVFVQQMEVKAFSPTNSLWPTSTRSEHSEHLHVDLSRLYPLGSNQLVLPGVVLFQEYFLSLPSYGDERNDDNGGHF